MAPAPVLPASIARRGAVMCYEAILLAAIAFIVSYAFLAGLGWSHPLDASQRFALQGVLLLSFAVYFVYCWSRSGQTLAMKSWHVRVLDESGARPSPARALLRYLAAWTLFLPAALLLWVLPIGPRITLAVLVASVVGMSLVARLDPERRWWHDRLSRTRLVYQRN